MSWLVRLYPRSWQKRYGPELEDLLHEMPGKAGVALDLLVGAAIAYRDVIRRDRFLSAAGAYLHGISVAVLVQAIAFVSLILVAHNAPQTNAQVGPFVFATVSIGGYFGLRPEYLQAPAVLHAFGLTTTEVPSMVLLLVLVLALSIVLAAPRLLRSLR